MQLFTLFTRKSLALLACLLATVAAQAAAPQVLGPPPTPGIEFVANKKQWDQSVLFAADVPGGRLFLTPGRLVQALYDASAVEEVHHHAASATQAINAHAYSVTFVGADGQAVVQGEEQRSTHTNYLLGNDPRKWASQVPAYGAVRYQALYPGTDLRLYTHDNQVEYDFELLPGADAGRIALRYDGQQHLRLQDGALHVTTSVGTVVEQRPSAYQLRDGHREAVPCEYVLGAGHTVSFALPRGYDHSRPLVIDPVLVYSSYSGSAASNWGYSSTYDAQGNLYCGGIAFALNFPTTVGAYSVTFAGLQDLAIMKFNPSATTGAASLAYATFIGGSGAEHPHSLLVDGGGNLLLYGSTSSANYPVTAGAYDPSFNGGADIVVTRLSATGSALLASTFVGGMGIDGQLPLSSSASALFKNFGDGFRGDLALDRAGNVYVASNTQSANFPRIGGVQPTLSGTRDAVVFKLTPSLAGLQWSTFLGGTGEDAAYSIQVDSVSNVFVCGGTNSTTFPGTAGGLRPSYGGGTTDGFVARLSAAGTTLVQSTYLGTSGYDQAYFVQFDRQGQVYILGQTDGSYPVSAGVYNNPNSLQFIHKLRPTLTSGWWSTVVGNGRGIGASTNLSPTAFLVDNCGQILLSGYGANIASMPVTPDAIKLTPTKPGNFGIDGDFYIMELAANAGRLVYGTYFGNGTLHVDGGASRFDKSGVMYQTVCASGGSFNPATTTPNAWARAGGNGGRNAIAFKIDVGQLNAMFLPTNLPTSPLVVRRQCAPARYYFNRTSVTGTRVRWDFGNGQTATQGPNASYTYTVPGTYVVRLTVFDSTNCLQSVSAIDTVRVYAGPKAAITTSRGQYVCQGNTVLLTATNANPAATGVVYAWSPAAGLSATSGATVTAQPTITTRYTVTASAAALGSIAGCVTTDTITVRVLTRVPVVAGPPRAFCPGAETTLSVADFGPGATYVWTAPGQPARLGPRIVVRPAASIRYLVRVVDARGCQGRDSVQLTLAPRPVLAAVASAPNLVNKPVQFTNTTTGATSYRWEFGDNSAGSTEANPLHTYTTAPQEPFQARLTAIYGPNCEESMLVPVPVRRFDLPNIITPNGDNLNDSFKPFVTPETVDIQIFNRWGRLVFEQKNYTHGWGAADTPRGLYFYRLVNASGETWKGWLEVVY